MIEMDAIIEVICQSLTEDHFEDIQIKTITLHPPIDNSQLITTCDYNGNKFSIEIKKL